MGRWTLVPIVLALVAVDYATGPYFQFPSVYVVLIVAASWFIDVTAGLTLAVVMPLTRVLLMEMVWHQPWDPVAYLSTAAARMASWSLLAVMTARLAHHERNLRREVDVLVSLLPVCAYCHKIQASDERWQPLDAYASEHRDQFRHALCPDCARRQFPEHFPPA